MAHTVSPSGFLDGQIAKLLLKSFRQVGGNLQKDYFVSYGDSTIFRLCVVREFNQSLDLNSQAVSSAVLLEKIASLLEATVALHL